MGSEDTCQKQIEFLDSQFLKVNKQLETANKSLDLCNTRFKKQQEVMEQEKKMLNNALDQITLMIQEREKLYEELEQLNQTVIDNFNNLVSILSCIIESRRQYHTGHSKKVAEIAVFIAKELNFSQQELREIEIAALLHEIGKVSIAESILMKNPTLYSEHEQDIVVQHPVRGSAILNNFIGFEKIAYTIEHIHEEYNGTGIPKGLKGDEIPLESRIIAVANIFDNLAYRTEKRSREQIFSIIEESVSVRFDSRIVYYLNLYASFNPITDKDRIKAIKLYDLVAGMELASSIYTVNGAKLLPANSVLSDEIIERIIQYNKKESLEEIVFIK